MQKYITWLAAPVALAAAVASAEILELDFASHDGAERTQPIAAGAFYEVCGPLAAGDRVSWAFSAAQALDFNLHYHQGDEVVYPEKNDGVERLEGMFEAPIDQTYCWMWTNPHDQPLELAWRARLVGA